LKPATYEELSRDNLDLGELATRMAACINTNIKEHFFKRQCKFLMVRDGLTKDEARTLQSEVKCSASSGSVP
jgi:hypothetical protein